VRSTVALTDWSPRDQAPNLRAGTAMVGRSTTGTVLGGASFYQNASMLPICTTHPLAPRLGSRVIVSAVVRLFL